MQIMNTIDIKIDWVDKNFAAAVADERIACVATGKTLDEVKHNIIEALEFHLEGMKQSGEPVPSASSSVRVRSGERNTSE